MVSLVLVDVLLQLISAVAVNIGEPFTDDLYWPALPQAVAATCIGVVRERCDESVLRSRTLVGRAFIYVMILGVNSVIFAVARFGKHRSVFVRDRRAGQSRFAYFLAAVVWDLVHIVRIGGVYLGIVYLIASPRGGFGWWLAAYLLTIFAASGLAYVVSLLVRYSRGATAVAVIAIVCASVTSGTTPSLDVVDGWGPLQLFWYLSHARWAVELFTILPVQQAANSARMAIAVDAAGFDLDNRATDLAVLAALGVAWRILAYMVMRWNDYNDARASRQSKKLH